MEKVGSYEAKTHLPRLLKRVESGESITITRHGVPIALLVPPPGRKIINTQKVLQEVRSFRKGRTLGGVTVRDMVEEGRRS